MLATRGPPGGELAFVSKRVSAVGNKRISQFSANAPRSQVGSLDDSVVVVTLYSYIVFKVWRENKLNKKFVVAKNFAELVSKGIKAILFTFVYFTSAWHDRMLQATSDLAD